MLSDQGSDAREAAPEASADTEPQQAEPHAEPGADADGLTAREQAILAFERQWWSHAGAKEEAIRTRLGLSAARYYQLLGALIDSPHALAADPMLVKRLQRMRHARNEARARRSLGPTPSTPAPGRSAGAARPTRTESD
ncbi:DUF3263 domain-containing protein [Cryobacterium tepidiphilum]|jgi:hypothetical protein|uniref:DUF3263 domain-containing protein n=1 Tax=Cryobacterium tepidiphilum TaxID=2486026 RepID=A0A3M8LHU4_9MICO|nr:DUF3263 domain-containing protein [Cryobacterium tepidiphilum]RNE64058.1 DUF3263 domain-containing protein [Cryobacterium tepidiphilum]